MIRLGYLLWKQMLRVLVLPFTNFDTLGKVIFTFLSPSFLSCKSIVILSYQLKDLSKQLCAVSIHA